MSDRAPRLTVAICTRNRGASIRATVESVLDSAFRELELLVVDQSTDDATAQALAPLAADPRLRYVRTDTVGIGLSRNLAVQWASTELIAFTDDDCTVPTDWAGTLYDLFEEHPDVAMIYCSVRAVPHDRSAGFVPTYERPGDHVLRTMRDKCRSRGIGAGMALRRSAALAVGNFDAALGSRFPGVVGEEGDLTVRLLLNGYGVLETDRTHVMHDGFRTWEQGRDLTRRNFIGIGLVCAKPVRCGRWTSLAVVLYEGVVVAALWPLNSLLRGRPPRGLRAFPFFWVGFLRGLATPVDRRTMNFVTDPGQPDPLVPALPEAAAGDGRGGSGA